jgi:general secretion pathway protein B
MSLILDALRKADAERERGSVPSLYSQPVASPSAEVPPKPRVGPNWLWIAIGIAVGLSGAAAWVMVGRDAAQPGAAATRTAAQPSASMTPPAAAVAPASPPPSAPAPAVAEPAPWPQPEERKAARPEAKGDVPVRVIGNMPPAEAQVYARDQLPPDIRAALPQFAIGGSMYSPNPAARSLIVNGQLYREKDRLTPELVLEEVKLKAAVFSFRGYRFEVLF